MFSKAALISLVLGALYVNSLTIPVAREPECEFPPSFHTIPYHTVSLSDLRFLQQPKTSSYFRAIPRTGPSGLKASVTRNPSASLSILAHDPVPP